MDLARMIVLAAIVWVGQPGVVRADGDSSTNLVIENSPELVKARDDYKKLINAARDRLLEAFADEEDTLTSSSKFKPEEKLKRLDQLEKERQEFEESGQLPKSVSLKKAVESYKKQTQQARDNCSKVFDSQANKLLRTDREGAADILAAKKELLNPPTKPVEPPVPPITPPPAAPQKEQIFTGHTGKVSGVRFVPGTPLLITGGNSFFKVSNGAGKGSTNNPGDDNTIRLWNTENGQMLAAIKDGLGHPNKTTWQVQGLNLSFDNTAFAVATCRPSADYCNPTISVWAVKTGEPLALFALTGRAGVWAPWFSPDGKTLHAFRADTTWHYLDLPTRKELQVKKLEESAGEEDMLCVAMSSNRDRVYGGMKGGEVRVWSLPEGKELSRFTGHTGPVLSLAVSPDDKLIASAGADGAVRLWEADTGKEAHKLSHTGRVLAVTFTIDGTRVVTGGEERSAIVWDVMNGTKVKRFQGHTGEIMSLDISSDRKWLATGSADKTARTWAMP